MYSTHTSHAVAQAMYRIMGYFHDLLIFANRIQFAKICIINSECTRVMASDSSYSQKLAYAKIKRYMVQYTCMMLHSYRIYSNSSHPQIVAGINIRVRYIHHIHYIVHTSRELGSTPHNYACAYACNRSRAITCALQLSEKVCKVMRSVM